MSSLPPLSCPRSLPYHILAPSLIMSSLPPLSCPRSLPYHVLAPSLIISSLPPLSCPRSLPYHVLAPSLIMSSLPPLSCPRSLPYHILAPSLIMSSLPPLSCPRSLPYHVLAPSLIMSSLPPLSCPRSLPYHVLAPSLSCPHSLPYHVLAPSLIMYSLANPDPRTHEGLIPSPYTALSQRYLLYVSVRGYIYTCSKHLGFITCSEIWLALHSWLQRDKTVQTLSVCEGQASPDYLSSSLHSLPHHPLNSSQDAPMYDAIQELHYLDMVVQESLRVYPPAPRYCLLL